MHVSVSHRQEQVEPAVVALHGSSFCGVCISVERYSRQVFPGLCFCFSLLHGCLAHFFYSSDLPKFNEMPEFCLSFLSALAPPRPKLGFIADRAASVLAKVCCFRCCLFAACSFVVQLVFLSAPLRTAGPRGRIRDGRQVSRFGAPQIVRQRAQDHRHGRWHRVGPRDGLQGRPQLARPRVSNQRQNQVYMPSLFPPALTRIHPHVPFRPAYSDFRRWFFLYSLILSSASACHSSDAARPPRIWTKSTK
jgi:hypothetical protein